MSLTEYSERNIEKEEFQQYLKQPPVIDSTMSFLLGTENANKLPSVKIIVTFFARPRKSLGNSPPLLEINPSLEPDFSNKLASLAEPLCPITPSFQSLSHRVHQATYITSSPAACALRQSPSISIFEVFHSLEIVVDILPDSTLSYHPIQLVIFDMDSTLIKEEVIDELARSVGLTSAVSAITAKAMNGELDFTESLRARLALLKGVDAGIWKELQKSLSIVAGAKELCAELRRRGVITAVASGGFIPMAEWLKNELGLDYAFANHLPISPPTPTYPYPHLSGVLSPDHPIISPGEKRNILFALAAKHGIPPAHTMAVGDGANDLLMLRAAGLGVAWRAKDKVQREAPNRLNGERLDELLALIGPWGEGEAEGEEEGKGSGGDQ